MAKNSGSRALDICCTQPQKFSLLSGRSELSFPLRRYGGLRLTDTSTNTGPTRISINGARHQRMVHPCMYVGAPLTAMVKRFETLVLSTSRHHLSSCVGAFAPIHTVGTVCKCEDIFCCLSSKHILRTE